MNATLKACGGVNGVAAELTRARIAWMWSDDLPSDYVEKRRRLVPPWLRTAKRFPIILRGSRERYHENYCSSAENFILRAIRMLKLTTPCAHTRRVCEDRQYRRTLAIRNDAVRRFVGVQPARLSTTLEAGYHFSNGKIVRCARCESLHDQLRGTDVSEVGLRALAIDNIARSMDAIERTEKLHCESASI